MIRTVVVGGLEIPIGASHRLEQIYETFGGWTVLRMMDGAAVKQAHWQRIRTRITGQGVIPPGLQGLNYDQSMTLLCAEVRSVVSASTAIALPSARRVDSGYEPYGLAQMPRGDMVPTTCNIAGDTATLGAVSGAIGYAVCYWPQITVIAEPPRETMDVRRGSPSWELNAEEI